MHNDISNQKLNILCLHGYEQNSSIMYLKTGFLRRCLKPYCNMIYLDAPFTIYTEQNKDLEKETLDESTIGNLNVQHIRMDLTSAKCLSIESLPQNNMNNEFPLRGWFKPVIINNTTEAAGLEDSIDYIINYVKQNNLRIDGLLGFSQGAALTAILLALRQTKLKDSLYKNVLKDIKLGIIIGGYLPKFSNLDIRLCNDNNLSVDITQCSKLSTIDIPSFHCWGKSDKVIEYSKSIKLKDKLFDPQYTFVYEHEKGHMVPHSADFKKALVGFIKKVKQSLPTSD